MGEERSDQPLLNLGDVPQAEPQVGQYLPGRFDLPEGDALGEGECQDLSADGEEPSQVAVEPFPAVLVPDAESGVHDSDSDSGSGSSSSDGDDAEEDVSDSDASSHTDDDVSLQRGIDEEPNLDGGRPVRERRPPLVFSPSRTGPYHHDRRGGDYVERVLPNHGNNSSCQAKLRRPAVVSHCALSTNHVWRRGGCLLESSHFFAAG